MSDEQKESLSARTVKNVAWLGSSQAIRQFVGIVTTLLMARFLLPSDYGIFAMTLFVAELAQLFVDFGIGSALIQRKHVDQRMLSTCFWLNMGVAVIAGLVVVASGPFAAAYFKQPLVAQLLLVCAVNLLISGMAVLPQAVLSRQLAMHHVAVGTTIGSLSAAAVTLSMAAAGFGVWALVFQPLIGTTVNLAYLLWKSRWRPSMVFDLSSIDGVLRFSGHMLAGGTVSQFTRNMPHLIFAPTLGASALGLLSMAMTVAWTPVAQLSGVAVRAIYPAFARLQDEKARMSAALFRALEVIGLVSWPILTALAVMASDLMPTVFGPQWADAAPLVTIFCVVSMIQCITSLSGSTLLALGRSDIGMRLALVSLPVAFIALWPVRNETLPVAALALAGSTVFMLLLGFWFAVRNLGCGWRALLQLLARPLAASAVMGLSMAVLQAQLQGHLPALGRMVVVAIAGVLVYGLATWTLNRAALLGTVSLLRQTFDRRRGTAAGSVDERA